MNEQVLKSIIQLLALSATVDGAVSDSERRVIEEFIHANLSEENAKSFIKLFDEYEEIAATGSIEPVNICNRINVELNQKQKIIVLFHLLELISADGGAEEKAINFVDLVADAFNIDVHEYNIIKAFVTDEQAIHLGLSNILVITGQQMGAKVRHIYRPGLAPKIGILRIPSLEMYMLKYFGGETNTFLNGMLLKDHYIYPFPNGSVIRNEKTTSIYYSDVVTQFLQDNQEEKFTFEAKHVYYTFPGGKIGLRDINIAEESGRLVGIMGSSGSGKSTLLNVLNGNAIPIGGKVTINHIDVHSEEDKAQIQGVIGYVPQDDLLIEELTVFQNMYFAAKLCFGNYKEEEIKGLANKTLASLGLQEIADLKVGSTLQKTISGGQRKRLNIGLELLREPSILFIDEPTSGLSSKDSENILDLLKELSLKGKLIFVVIHQPSSDIFKMFDRLLILDVGGYQIYYGNPIEAVTYFKKLAELVNPEEAVCLRCGNVNAEQIFNVIETKLVDEYGRYTKQRKVSPVQWRKHFEEQAPVIKLETSDTPPESTLRIPSKLKQWSIFAKRDMLAKLSNTQYMVISLLEAPLLALILSYIVRYYHLDHSEGLDKYIFSENMNLPAYIFMSIIVALFIGLTVSAEEIFKDAKILKREAFLHLSRSSYLLSKIAILFSFSAIQTLSYVLIGNWILGIEGLHFSHWLVLFSTACFANMLGLNISSTFNSVITIYILIPILLIPQLILGGIVVKFDNVNPHLASHDKVPLISEFMTARWAFEAIMVSQFKDNAYEKPLYAYDKRLANAEYKNVYYISKLNSLVTFCNTHYSATDLETRNKMDKNIVLLQEEIQKELKATPAIPFPQIEMITPDRLDRATLKDIKTYLDKLKKHYVRTYNRVAAARDKMVAAMTDTPEKRDAFVEKARRYHNKAIERTVKNSDIFKRIVEIDGKLIPKIYPVFLDPVNDSPYYLNLRAHFYAPGKKPFGYFVDTLYFNVIIIWIMTFVLYVLLYYRVFRESFKVFTILFSRKRKRR